jgi:hypothetical protein
MRPSVTCGSDETHQSKQYDNAREEGVRHQQKQDAEHKDRPKHTLVSMASMFMLLVLSASMMFVPLMYRWLWLSRLNGRVYLERVEPDRRTRGRLLEFGLRRRA